MKKYFSIVFIAVLAAAVFGIIGKNFVSRAQEEPTHRKIIIFKEGVLNEKAREALVKKFGGVKIKDLNLIGGKAVLLPPKAEAVLSRQEGILRIDDDVEVFALEKSRSQTNNQPPQVVPWGINRVNAPQVWSATAADPIKVAVVDTGIDLKHPDLINNIKGGYNAINPLKSANDDNGHGTHVAGIIAATDNAIGVVGVGPKIDLYAVKVLNAAGSGYLSDIIEGLDWAITNGIQVVNMSLGTSSDIQSFHDAVIRTNQAGITQVAAAGNSGGAVNYPAAYPETIAVSATDSSDNIASWSSRGPEVDLAAPGVNIYSTYKGQTYKTLSGTSMASPHAAGAAALVLSVPAKCDFNLDGKCSPVEVQQRMEATAADLGDYGKDVLYGAGLVNAYAAVMNP